MSVTSSKQNNLIFAWRFPVIRTDRFNFGPPMYLPLCARLPIVVSAVTSDAEGSSLGPTKISLGPVYPRCIPEKKWTSLNNTEKKEWVENTMSELPEWGVPSER